MTDTLFAPLSLRHGRPLRNRLCLAPLTNLQSNDDGTLSDDELRWLILRARGGFALTLTCASHVQAIGKGFPGQLGVFSDAHLPGLSRLARAISAEGGLSAVQLQHSGMRAPKELIGDAPVGAFEDAETGTRALSTGEVEQVVEDFIVAGLRAQCAGFDGVEIHGAHGYLLCQFLDVGRNTRADKYGGSPENRARVLFEIISGLRGRAGADFQIGVRLSPERYGVDFHEARALAARLMANDAVDYIDLSMWDVRKAPPDAASQDKPLLDYFLDLERHGCRLCVAGKIMGAAEARWCLEQGVDAVLIGRGAVLHHDFPRRIESDPAFVAAFRPVTRDYLRAEGLGERFVDYMASWKGFVAD